MSGYNRPHRYEKTTKNSDESLTVVTRPSPKAGTEMGSLCHFIFIFSRCRMIGIGIHLVNISIRLSSLLLRFMIKRFLKEEPTQ